MLPTSRGAAALPTLCVRTFFVQFLRMLLSLQTRLFVAFSAWGCGPSFFSVAMAERDSSDDEEATIASDLVVTKYKTASDIANSTLATLIKECIPGASVRSLCQRGDALILADTGKVFKKDKEMKKGISFPTCLSINQCLCCFSPLASDPDVILAEGDMVKIELGTHIDGFISQTAHTLVVGASKENKVTGRKADALLACHLAAEAAHRLLKPGGSDEAVAETVQKIAEAFECKPIEGTQSFQMTRNEVCGEKTIVLNRGEAAGAARKAVDKCEFAMNEVYSIDIAVSTGDGKPRPTDTRTTVHRRTDEQYNLKMKASRIFFSEVCLHACLFFFHLFRVFHSFPSSFQIWRVCLTRSRAHDGLLRLSVSP